jgi:hypothetical protein
MNRSSRIAIAPVAMMLVATAIASPATLADVGSAVGAFGGDALPAEEQGASSGWSGLPRLELKLAAAGGGNEEAPALLFKDPTVTDGFGLAGASVQGSASSMGSLFTAAAWMIGLGLLTLAGFNSRKRRGS